MADATIVVLSKDKDFAEPLAEQIRKELALSCVVADHEERARSLMAAASLVVATEALEDCSCPVLVVKKPPVRLLEVLEEIVAMRQKQSADDMVLARGYTLQPRQKQLLHSGKAFDLTDKEAQLLQCLAEANGKIVAKEQLLKQVWGIDSLLDTHTLETHIYRLRSKFRELGGDDTMVAAESGGYALAVK